MMPGEPSPKPNRWEGTQTYKKPGARKARTVAQLREEAAAKSKANREEAINRRRGSIGSLEEIEVPAGKRSATDRGAVRRGSTGGLPTVEGGGARASKERARERAEESKEEGAMPNSGKKKGTPSRKSGDPGDGVDPALKRFLNAMKADLMDTTREAVGRLETRLERNETSIANLEKRMEQSEKAIEIKVASEVAKQCAAATKGGLAPPDKREAAYHFSRRSLKLWPVEGENLEDAVRVFLRNKLSMSDARIRSLGAIDVAATPGKAARGRREVLATFESKEDRDNVKANGINLAGQREVGMSLHVPGFLMDNLVALNGLGYSIKQKNPGIKRAVKFDDLRQDLYLDICINDQWKRISPTEAKQVMKEVPLSNSTSGTAISVPELLDLVQGKEAEGANAIVVPDDSMEP